MNIVAPTENISIYIHWPFCSLKCPYCDFNSYATSKPVDMQIWLKTYMQTIENNKIFFANKNIKSIFFGGGTPSLMSPFIVESIIKYFNAHNSSMGYCAINEITLESNPSTFEVSRFKDFSQAGVTRISTGVQSFNEKNLKFLGRNHNVKEAIIALEKSSEIFERSSFDLIMGLHSQSLSDWKQELGIASEFIKDHISIYQLTIEEGTPFFTKKVKEISENISADIYSETVDFLDKLGLQQYEISNFAKTGFESTHNLNYWLGGEYIGIGPGAHGRVKNNKQWIATMEHKNPQKWLNNVLNNQNNYNVYENISNSERIIEKTLTSFRLNTAIPKDVANTLNKEKITKLINEDLLAEINGELYTTKLGKTLLNYVLYQVM